MASFVGDLWKKVGELNLSKLSGNALGRPSSSFPFLFDETTTTTRTIIGPFMKYQGQDYEISSRKETSVFRRVNIFVCRDKKRIDEAKRIVKALKTLKHPRILRYIASTESDSEVLLVTECADRLGNEEEFGDEDGEWQSWAYWSLKEVYEFLSKNAGKEISYSVESGNLWKTPSGEVKVALFNENYSDDNFDSTMRRIFPAARPDSIRNELIQLTESFDHLVTLSAGERISLLKKLISCKRNEFCKYLALPELVKTRKQLTRQPSTGSTGANSVQPIEISMEEVHFIFVKGKALILFDSKDSKDSVGSSDFMFLLSDFYIELLGKYGVNPVPLTVCLLDLMGNQGLTALFTEKYCQDSVYPLVSVLLGHGLAIVREAALKALQELCEKLNGKTIGNEVLRQLARLQGDSEGAIRFKALTVLSGTIWQKLPDPLKAKICGPAVARALSDPFISCRRSGLQLLKQGLGLLPPSEIATKLIPSVAGLLISEDAGTRNEAFDCMEKLILPTLKKAVNDSNNQMVKKVITDEDSSKGKNVISAGCIGSHGRERESERVSLSVSKLSVSQSDSSQSPQPQPQPQSTMTQTTSTPAASGKMRLGSIKKII